MERDLSVLRAGIRIQIQEIIARIAHVGVDELADDIKVREEAGIDSIQTLEIISRCEQVLGIHIDESELSGIDTIGDFIDYLVEKSRKLHENN